MKQAKEENSIRCVGAVALLLMLAVCMSSCKTCEPCQVAPEVKQPAADFYFVQISDTHFGQGDHAARVAAIVDEINAMSLDLKCVVVTGDICHHSDDDAARQQAKEMLGKLELPVHVLPGNHDIPGVNPAVEVSAFEQAFGPIFQTTNYEGVVFLFTYLKPKRSILTQDGLTPIEWTAQALERANDKPVLVFHHIPSVGNFYNGEFHDGWPVKQKMAWEELLSLHNVRAVIAGHLHGNVLNWLGRIPLMVASSVSGSFGRQASYRIYHYKDGELSYWTVYTQPIVENPVRPFISATASSQGTRNIAAAAADRNLRTRWESDHQDGPEWLVLELDKQRAISEIFIDWEHASAADYDVQLSQDGETWTTVASIMGASPDEDRTITFDSTLTKFIRIWATKRATQWGYSIWDIDVY